MTRGKGYWGGTNDRLLRLKAGRILIPAAKGFAHVWISDDDGVTWRMGGKPLPPEDSGSEPTLVELADGTVKMFLRTRSGNIWIAESDDGGESWGNVDKWGPAGAAAPAMVRRVPGRRDLLLIWCNNPIRSNLTSAISRDGGRLWENYRILEAQEGWPLTRSHCYPSLAFLNGNAHMTYWETHRHTAVERLFHLVYRRLPVSWFYEQTERRPPLHDMKRILRRVYQPDTVFDGERRPKRT